MDRKRCGKLIPLAFMYTSLCLLFLVFASPGWAAPLPQTTQDDGQEYIVQAGDSLYKISGQFYGQPDAYDVIIEATNAKAATDDRFTPITDPRRIRAGQRLWIPNDPALPINALSTAAPTPAATPSAALTETSATTPTGPSVQFVTPIDGATVPPTFTVVMSATNLTVEPAGEIQEGSGHFHILVDTDFVPAGEVIINDEQHLHFGQGQYTTTLGLEPGVHVLRLQFADGAHIALDGAAYQDTITVTVGADATTANPNALSSEPSVRFVTPIDGAIVPPTFTVTMSATALLVEPAGTIQEGSGHFHILVDTDFVEAGEVIISDEQHLHFGQGQYTTTLGLEPGVHVLRLQFANGAHIALDGENYQDIITVTVAGSASTAVGAPGVQFVTPIDGATVPPTFTVVMSATNLTVEPAGEIQEGSGHFHILVDTDFVPAGEVIINDEQHLHFGRGQSTTTLGLEPGVHVLRLQFADGAHIALDGAAYQDTITVTVGATTTANPSAVSSGPSVRFVTPIDGGTVPPTFTVVMSATALLVEPAGTIQEGSGHFHILVDTDFVEAGEVIISDEQHLHFGQGQYTTTLGLEPGVHVLRLQFANGAHIALDGENYQDTITVTVSADATEPAPATSAQPSVRFVTPVDNATVPAKFAVEMAATGLTVEPAGTLHQAAGHFHILVDTPFVKAGEVIINDQQHLHFGKGEYTTTLELTPGQHVLRLQFANGAHIALAGDAYRDEITVTAK